MLEKTPLIVVELQEHFKHIITPPSFKKKNYKLISNLSEIIFLVVK